MEDEIVTTIKERKHTVQGYTYVQKYFIKFLPKDSNLKTGDKIKIKIRKL